MNPAIFVRTISAPPFTPEAIRTKADSLIRDYVHLVGPSHAERNGLRFEDVFVKLIAPRFGITLIEGAHLGRHPTEKAILAAADVISNRMFVSDSLGVDRGDPRRQFTLWHEVAHLLLQGNWLRAEVRRLYTEPFVATTEVGITDDTRALLERQANLYASVACAPKWLVAFAICRRFGMKPNDRLRYKGPAPYSFQIGSRSISRNIQGFEHYCRTIAVQIRHLFGNLSIEAMSYRVAECPLVIDCTKQPSFILHRLAS